MSKPIRVAINGFGRIGKMTLRAFLERDEPGIEVVAINELAHIEQAAQLFRLDSVHGRLQREVTVIHPMIGWDELQVREKSFFYLSEPNPTKLPWKELDIDIVLECTGRFTDGVSVSAHLMAGAQHVIVSAPAKDVPMIVYGVNDATYSGDHGSVAMTSNASCTTNCVAPIARAIHAAFGIAHGNLLTVHAATAGQNVVDGVPPGRKGGDLRLARATLGSMIPTNTGAAKAVGEVLPELRGKFDGVSVRVPTLAGSYCHCTFEVERVTTVGYVIEALHAAMEDPTYHDVLCVRDEPFVSQDIVHDSHSAIVDAEFVRVVDGTQVIVGAWYDNEWGYSNRMVDLTAHVVGPTLR